MKLITASILLSHVRIHPVFLCSNHWSPQSLTPTLSFTQILSHLLLFCWWWKASFSGMLENSGYCTLIPSILSLSHLLGLPGGLELRFWFLPIEYQSDVIIDLTTWIWALITLLFISANGRFLYQLGDWFTWAHFWPLHSNKAWVQADCSEVVECLILFIIFL